MFVLACQNYSYTYLTFSIFILSHQRYIMKIENIKFKNPNQLIILAMDRMNKWSQIPNGKTGILGTKDASTRL